MQYKLTGGIENGICYTRLVEETEEDQQQPQALGMKQKEGAVKSHGEETERLDIK